MSAQLLFDKLSYLDRLKSAGIDEKFARAHADGLEQAFREEVATKTDIAALAEAVRTEIKDAKFAILQWVIGAIGFQTLVLVGAVIAVFKIH